jgi:predicted DNA-binding protein with PD1-like motif
MHIACGREESTVTGCVRRGVNVWHLLEIILFELVDSSACRMFDELLGFELLEQREGK